MIITISGMPGSGKSTVAKIIAEKTELEYMNAGDVFRTLAHKKGMTLDEFSAYAELNPAIDQTIDKKVVEVAKKGDVVLEGRLAGVMCHRNEIEAKKVWLDAPLRVRAERVAKRENKKIESVISEIQERERSEWERYFKMYGVDLNNLDIYDMVIDTSDKSPEEIAEEVLKS